MMPLSTVVQLILSQTINFSWILILFESKLPEHDKLNILLTTGVNFHPSDMAEPDLGLSSRF